MARVGCVDLNMRGNNCPKYDTKIRTRDTPHLSLTRLARTNIFWA